MTARPSVPVFLRVWQAFEVDLDPHQVEIAIVPELCDDGVREYDLAGHPRRAGIRQTDDRDLGLPVVLESTDDPRDLMIGEIRDRRSRSGAVER